MIYDKEAIRARHKKLPEEFDMDHDFLSSLIFTDNNYDPNLVIDGKLWLRELFMKAQTNIKQLNIPIYVILCFLISASYPAATIILDYK